MKQSEGILNSWVIIVIDNFVFVFFKKELLFCQVLESIVTSSVFY